MGVSSCKNVCLEQCQPRKHYSHRGQLLHPRSPGAIRTEPRVLDFSHADRKKWRFPKVAFSGSYTCTATGGELFEAESAEIKDGLRKVKEHPDVYEGIMYQSNMVNWPADQQQYSLLRRCNAHFSVKAQKDGPFTVCQAMYQALPRKATGERDAFTDTLLSTYGGNRLGTALHPGRGEGLADHPSLRIIADVDPADVNQEGVGDCWLLSAISTLAEYDGAIRALFRHTEDLAHMPKDSFNRYTITLHDLPSCEEVDIVVDERLCTKPHSDNLLGAAPSASGELWVCYLEKAVAAHCGGWDRVTGGTPTHAWKLLTGCQEQYIIKRDSKTRFFRCWKPVGTDANSPLDSSKMIESVDWPDVGGGGQEPLDDNELFERMCAWEDSNFLMAAGSAGKDNKTTHDGIVDGHAYSILGCVDNAAETEFDLIQVRNPWGSGEFQSGKWVDDGPGWEEHPEIHDLLKPTQANDGVFWLDKDEFFGHFQSIYLCAKDMSQFCAH